jgi:hypothetical protein
VRDLESSFAFPPQNRERCDRRGVSFALSLFIRCMENIDLGTDVLLGCLTNSPLSTASARHPTPLPISPTSLHPHLGYDKSRVALLYGLPFAAQISSTQTNSHADPKIVRQVCRVHWLSSISTTLAYAVSSYAAGYYSSAGRHP